MSPNAKPDPSAEGGQSEKPYSRLDELREGELKKGDCGSSPEQPPSWLDKEMFDRARELFKKHFFSIFFCHLSGLMFIVHLPKMTETLLSTGHSSSVVCLFRRYLSTLVHIRRWYEGDIWNPDDPAHQSITLVRSMHRRVADRLNEESTSTNTCSSVLGKDEGIKYLNSSSYSNGTGMASNRQNMATFQDYKPNSLRKGNHSEKRCPMQTRSTSESMAISQFDMALTQFAFVGLILSHPEHVGIRCSREDLECLIHFWRGVGYMLGVEDRYNLCNGGLDETVAICKNIMESELKPSLLQASKESSSMSKGEIGSKPDVSSTTHQLEEFCIMLENIFNEHTLIYKAEVDAVIPYRYPGPGSGDTSCYTELKTSRTRTRISAEMYFYRNKLLNWWTQSYLAGIPEVICGMRDDLGIVNSLEVIRISNMPNLAQGFWSPDVCLHFCDYFLNYLKKTVIEDDPKYIYYFHFISLSMLNHTVQYL
ncbi:uncharacterized protein LOC129222930 [Uloborus diversus]|uniref:uncharacterized protein LOC129222930 n=1 Tax=Uloborus diversus TaxID=327109 RepID=UPI00240A8E37|nr:uncharacterized protein LOC129222930 [Uloborus diversus]